MLLPGMHIHLVGIGGTGLSAIATVLLGQGYVISGSDRQLNNFTDALDAAGATVFEGHRMEQILGADVLLISSAIPEDNPEVQAARKANIPVLKRNDFLGLLLQGVNGIAVAGTHGKTTTTGMIAQIMIAGGRDPSVIVGAILPVLGSNGRAGQGNDFIIEADEYDHMFLGLRPSQAVITNIEYDHPDLFPNQEQYYGSFSDFVLTIRKGGRLFACADDVGAAAMAEAAAVSSDLEVCTYGFDKGDWQALEVRSNQLGGSDFLVHQGKRMIGLARLRVPGRHNVLNALAAIAVTSTLGLDFDTIRRALASFGGLGRRFQVVGEAGDVTIIDDYAHHPTEIRATLAAARQRYPGRRLWAVWQPHTFSRTKAMLEDFAHCFAQADRVIALDVYRSRENHSLDFDMSQVVASIQSPQVNYVGGTTEAANFLYERVLPGDVVITLSAGDGNLAGQLLLQSLEKRLYTGNGLAPADKGPNGH